MKYYLLLIWVIGGLVALYYVTVLLHIFFGVFKKGINMNKIFIPFYAWIVGLN